MSEKLANVKNVSIIDMDTVEGVIWSIWNVRPDISRVHEKLLVNFFSLCARCVLQYRGSMVDGALTASSSLNHNINTLINL